MNSCLKKDRPSQDYSTAGLFDLTNEGHSNGVVDSSGSAHGTGGSGRTETDWSDNGTSGGTSNPEAGGDTKITTLALATNHTPYSDSARD